MKVFTVRDKILLGLIVTLTACLFVPPAFGQTEKLGAVSYTPVKGWTRTAKENIVTFSQIDQSGGRFCFISLYGVTQGTGDPNGDFKREWNNLVVKPFRAEANPKTETEIADGWTMTAGGSAVDFQGDKAIAFLTVMSSGVRTVSILSIFNHESYTAQLTAFGGSIDVEKAVAQIPAPQQPIASPPAPASTASKPMHAVVLVKDFEANEIRANQVWVGKRVRIYGTINIIAFATDGRMYLTFKQSLGAYGNARCYFSRSQSSAVASLSANNEATVEGTVRGWEGGYSGAKVFLLLDDCIVP